MHTVASLLACAYVFGSPYCGPWFVVAVRVLFWMYVAVAFTSAVLQYLHLFCAPVHRLTIQSMTPAWILPIFPVLLGAVVASIIAPAQPLSSRWTITVAGITLLGMGWMVAFLILPLYLYRLMTLGLPAPNLRPGMFIAVGPPAFTGLALINFGSAITTSGDLEYLADKRLVLPVLAVMADLTAIFLWAFSFWFFSFSLIAVLSGIRRMSFHLVWWAVVFPNIVLALTTGCIGQRLNSHGIMWVGSAMTILLTAAWLFVVVINAYALLTQQIMMLGKDEDKGEQNLISMLHDRVLDRLQIAIKTTTRSRMSSSRFMVEPGLSLQQPLHFVNGAVFGARIAALILYQAGVNGNTFTQKPLFARSICVTCLTHCKS